MGVVDTEEDVEVGTAVDEVDELVVDDGAATGAKSSVNNLNATSPR